MSEASARPPRGTSPLDPIDPASPVDPYDPYREPIVGSGEHAARTGPESGASGGTGLARDPLDTSLPYELPYEPGLSGFGGTGRDPGPLDATGPAGPSSTGGTGEKAKEQASRVTQDAKESGAHVKDVATDKAADVAREAKSQAKGLLETTRSQVSEQASQQTRRAASGLSSLGDELQSLLSGDPQDGPATDLVRQAADRVSGAARWMEGREPADLLSDVQSFARRRPGTFLAIAAGIGLVAGRLTRGVAADAKEQHDAQGPSRTSTGGTTAPRPATTDASRPRRAATDRAATDPEVSW